MGDGDLSGDGRGKAANTETAFRAHLTSFLVFTLFFFTLNLITSPGSWWFYWPVFFWGWAVVFHAIATFGSAAPAGIMNTFRTLIPRGAASRARQDAGAAAGPAAASASAGDGDIAAVEARVARLWRTARQVPVEAVRERAFRVCVAADRVAEALATDRSGPELITWFGDRYLAPAETILEHYVRLARRGVASAEPALAKVESEDLPLLESRLDALYDRLHRGDVIELSVASEMLDLDLDLADKPPRPLRSPPKRRAAAASRPPSHRGHR